MRKSGADCHSDFVRTKPESSSTKSCIPLTRGLGVVLPGKTFKLDLNTVRCNSLASGNQKRIQRHIFMKLCIVKCNYTACRLEISGQILIIHPSKWPRLRGLGGPFPGNFEISIFAISRHLAIKISIYDEICHLSSNVKMS